MISEMILNDFKNDSEKIFKKMILNDLKKMI